MSIPVLRDTALLLHAHLAHLRLLLLLLRVPHLLVIVAAALDLLVATSLLLLHLLLRRIETALLDVALLHASHLGAIVALLLHAAHLSAHRRHDANADIATNDAALLLLRHDHAAATHLCTAVLSLRHLRLHLQ